MATPIYVTPEYDPKVPLKIARMTDFHIDPERLKLISVTVQLSRMMDRFEAIEAVKLRDDLQRTEKADSGVSFDFDAGHVTFDEIPPRNVGKVVDAWSGRLAQIENSGTTRRKNYDDALRTAKEVLSEVFPDQV